MVLVLIVKYSLQDLQNQPDFFSECLYFEVFSLGSMPPDPWGVSESMDGRGCAILALELVHKNPTQKFILQDFMLAVSVRKTMPH